MKATSSVKVCIQLTFTTALELIRNRNPEIIVCQLSPRTHLPLRDKLFGSLKKLKKNKKIFSTHYAKIAGSISERTAYYLLSIGKELESYKKIRQAFLNEEIGWTKVREILKVVDKINEDELLEQAKKLSRKELEDFVQCIKNKNIENAGSKDSKNQFESKSKLAHVQKSENKQIKLAEIAPGCRETMQPESEQGVSNLQLPTVQASHCSKPLTVTLTFTPEQYSILSKTCEKWKQENPDEWKREDMIINLCKDYLEKEQIKKSLNENKGEIIVVDSPYQVVVTHCEKCGDNHITTDKGVVKVDEAVYDIAMENGRILKIDSNGKTGENRRITSTAKKKKVIMRDVCRCSVPGCSRTRFLEVHHLIAIAFGGKDVES